MSSSLCITLSYIRFQFLKLYQLTHSWKDFYSQYIPASKPFHSSTPSRHDGLPRWREVSQLGSDFLNQIVGRGEKLYPQKLQVFVCFWRSLRMMFNPFFLEEAYKNYVLCMFMLFYSIFFGSGVEGRESWSFKFNPLNGDDWEKFYIITNGTKVIKSKSLAMLCRRYINSDPKSLNTVDGRNPAYYLQGFIHPRWVFTGFLNLQQ